MTERGTAVAPRRTQARLEELALWAALLVAFSPGLGSLVAHWQSAPWSRYSLSFVVLLALALRVEPRRDPRRVPGALLIGGCLLLQLAAFLLSIQPAVRPAFAGSLVGMLLLTGRASLRAATLAVWIVPVPWFVARSPIGAMLDGGLLDLAEAILPHVGLDPLGSGSSTALRRLFGPGNGAVPLLVHFSGLVWYFSLRSGHSWRGTLRSLAAALASALPVQLVVLVLAAAMMEAARPAWSIQLVLDARWVLPFAAVASFCSIRCTRPTAAQRA